MKRQKSNLAIGYVNSCCKNNSLNTVDISYYFDNNRNMETTTAIIALAALAQESRLTIFRLLVQAGSAGVTVGQIKEATGIPGSSLSFHLKELSHAGLIRARQESRFIYYSADYAVMNELLGFLTENCCGGSGCQSGCVTLTKEI
jgi:ArsR family transcriptional regulator